MLKDTAFRCVESLFTIRRPSYGLAREDLISRIWQFPRCHMSLEKGVLTGPHGKRSDIKHWRFFRIPITSFGSVRFVVDGKDRVVKPGEMIMIRRGSSYDMFPINGEPVSFSLIMDTIPVETLSGVTRWPSSHIIPRCRR